MHQSNGYVLSTAMNGSGRAINAPDDDCRMHSPYEVECFQMKHFWDSFFLWQWWMQLVESRGWVLPSEVPRTMNGTRETEGGLSSEALQQRSKWCSRIGGGWDSAQLVETPDDGEKKLECGSTAKYNLLHQSKWSVPPADGSGAADRQHKGL